MVGGLCSVANSIWARVVGAAVPEIARALEPIACPGASGQLKPWAIAIAIVSHVHGIMTRWERYEFNALGG